MREIVVRLYKVESSSRVLMCDMNRLCQDVLCPEQKSIELEGVDV